jgi:acyl-coenzyme A synthetase/AMP-(fatty) acid ligase
MGDTGFLDEKGDLWFCGRKAERVVTPTGTLFTEPCERVFRRHPRAVRCALIGLTDKQGATNPALVVESPLTRQAEALSLARELRELGKLQNHSASITRFLFHPRFPVDVRHNAKIHRLTLARWAAKATVYHVE